MTDLVAAAGSTAFFQTAGGSATIAALSALFGGVLVSVVNVVGTRKLADLQWKRDRLMPVMAEILSTSRSHMTLATEASMARAVMKDGQVDKARGKEYVDQLMVLTRQLRSAEPSVLLLGGRSLAIATDAFIEVHNDLDRAVHGVYTSFIHTATFTHFQAIDKIRDLLPTAELGLVDEARNVLKLDRFSGRKEQRWAAKQLKKAHAATPPSSHSVPRTDGTAAGRIT